MATLLYAKTGNLNPLGFRLVRRVPHSASFFPSSSFYFSQGDPDLMRHRRKVEGEVANLHPRFLLSVNAVFVKIGR